ncbi:hypothetical protein CEQ31_026620 [Serratia odorifera]|uniref:hypothetical protein n=1 Tax=Serratia odorifera TaxID=618 RepID=UPI000B4DF134|nr:hypothetical protein [Serratia odorifera]PNK82398.1 hypothetical protein CEQ31_026620 [Serratia odorifera]
MTAATLTADKATYVAGGAITLTVELKDAQATWCRISRYADGGDGEGSQCRTERHLDGNDPGTYSATYTAKTAGTGLKANLTLVV